MIDSGVVPGPELGGGVVAGGVVPGSELGGGVVAGGVVPGSELGGAVVADPIVILRRAEVMCPLASVTAKVNVLVPALTGVPDRTPELLKSRPVLQAPEHPLIAQV